MLDPPEGETEVRCASKRYVYDPFLSFVQLDLGHSLLPLVVCTTSNSEVVARVVLTDLPLSVELQVLEDSMGR